jgi:large subunit ribosomal protein L10
MADTQVRPDKAAAVAELTGEFRDAQAAVLTEYRGLTMAQLTALRLALGRETTYAVTKNTLAKIAARDAGLADLDELLAGPTAIAFVKGDPVEAAKGIRDYAKANPLLVVKGGVLDGRRMSAEEIAKLADLESREVLLAKLAGAMKAKMSQAAATFNALPTQLARLAQALAEKKAAEGGAAAPAAEDAPEAEAPTAEAPAAEA